MQVNNTLKFTHFVFSNFYSLENLAVYETRNVERYCTTGQATEMPMHIACWIPKATDTNSEYIILIPFPGQQRFRESA